MNDSMNLLAFQQHIFFRLPHKWFIQCGAWWHFRDKQLPASMSSTPVFTAFQKDQSIRQFVRATKWYRKSSFEMVAAFFTDSLLYAEKKSKTDSILKVSGIRSSDSYLSFYHRWFMSDHLTLENGADFEYQTAKVEAYAGLARETRGAFFSLLKIVVEQFSANLSYRQVFYSMTGPKPLFSAAWQYQVPVHGFSVKGQISNKFRFPTLNDRYWKPGGNPDLQPENGIGYDLGFVWDAKGSANSSINLSSTLFIQHINNWIQWVPIGTYWSPQNIKQVKCQGLELDFTGRWKIGNVGLIAKSMYTYSESLDFSLPISETRFHRQLAYVPFHLLKIQTGINIHRFEATLSYKFTGRRFTTDDHDPWLDLNPYLLADCSISYSFLTKKNEIVVTANMYNLFDTSYQLIRAYPAPGRSFYVSVNYLFNKKTKRND
jgi:iron complex outermembrane receptor protein